jgi:hypothetical protein
MIDISSYFATLSAAAGLVVIISGYVNAHVFVSSSATLKQIVSWVIAIAIAFVGQIKGIGMFVDTSILWTAANGLAVGLVANGIFDITIVQSVLEFIKAKKVTA